MIDEEGQKKFMFGQRTSNASFVFDNSGPHILCEGYATALSVRAALKAMKRRYTLHVCFSASNMIKVAAGLPSGLVIADNDSSATGERAAKQIGWPYWMSSVIGHDANDEMRAKGIYKFSQSLVRSLEGLRAVNNG
jgi:putative DNA primase/helicase